jgi:hypothetical protein
MNTGRTLSDGTGETRSWRRGAESPKAKLILGRSRIDVCRPSLIKEVSTQAQRGCPFAPLAGSQDLGGFLLSGLSSQKGAPC